jgi:prepilin-type N-terminal cleavage/methylation domain-containing protein
VIGGKGDMKFTITNLQFTSKKNGNWKMLNEKSHEVSGMSLIEILVVVTIFAILGIVVTRAVILTISGSKKSESLVRVRENLNYAMGVVERQLRNADAITTCPNTDASRIDYQDIYGNSTSFTCANGAVASGSAQLTSSEVVITACSFICQPGLSNNPVSVNVSFTAKDANTTGIQRSSVDLTSQIYLRNY